MTSEACKTLYNGNVALQSKHQALLARLPAGQAMTPSSSNTPVSSAAPSPHFYTSNLPRDRTSSTVSVEPPVPPRHFRRISVSPSDIAQLADQNAELMQTLQELEAESSHADQAGKRKLKRLEEEIQLLRGELEAAQTRSVELEQQVIVGTKVEKGSEEAEKRRLEREEKLRGLKAKVGSDGEDDEDAIPRDFAPSNPLGLSTSSRSSGSSTATSLQSPPATPSKASPSLITRLVNKIAELEQTNDQMNEQHRETEARLRQAEMDAETIRKLYSFLDDDPQVEVQVVDDEDTPANLSTDSQDHSVHFRSLRRSLHLDSARLSLDSRFDSGIKNVMQSTLRSHSNRLPLNAPHRNRKSVVGFFGSASHSSTGLPSETGSPFVFPPSPLKVETASYAPTEPSEFGASSPALSTLDLPANNFGRGHTLGSELGSQYGDDWAANAENHHLRTSSLYDLSSVTDAAPSPLLSPSSPTAEHTAFPPIPPSIAVQTATPPHPQPQPQDFLSQSTDAHLQLTPTPGRTDLPDADVDETPKSLGRSNMIERNRRLSQTVRSRTTHWVDRRFKDTLKSLGEDVESGDVPSSASLDLVLSPTNPFMSPPDEVQSPVVGVHSTAEAISAATGVAAPAAFTRVLDAVDAVVDQFVGVASSVKDDDPRPQSVVSKDLSSSASPVLNRSIRTRKASHAEVDASHQSKLKKQGLAAVMLEVWLWLQFVIIIVVFLWAMAKRGPKGVLKDAERRRAMSGASRR